MANPSLADYLAGLKSKAPQQIMEINSEVPRDYVITALALELERQKQYPVIKASIAGYELPLVTNVFSDLRRIADILACPEAEISRRWAEIEKPPLNLSR